MREIELLAPAKNAEVARAAILHGADAVYMGASAHGARRAAANSVADVASTVDFAHKYGVKVYVTVNTIIYEHELRDVEHLVGDLYRIGVDAIIVQDMALLRLDIPPIELHASTQCDIRTVQKAKFLEKVGFSRLVLARELSLGDIREIYDNTDVPLEVFVHGALCVSYSGRCHAGQYVASRSANRGECPQICRLPFTLTDASGKILAKDKHLLSLHDFNTSAKLEDLLEAGASSLKIEGRLKDAGYVKNVTAYYRRRLDEIIAAYPDKYRRSSYGRSDIGFTPDLAKSFNRGFTTYFLTEKDPVDLASVRTPKSLGEPLNGLDGLHNGDGISFFNRKGEYTGTAFNGERDGKIVTPNGLLDPRGLTLYRTYDHEFEKTLARDVAKRTLSIDIEIDERGVTATDEMGTEVRLPLECALERGQKPFDPQPVFKKLGGTPYRLNRFTNNLQADTFIPASQLTALRRKVMEHIQQAAKTTYKFHYRRKEDIDILYPEMDLDFRSNVANSVAEAFYRDHGVRRIEPALEVSGRRGELNVMTTRYCVLRQLGLCKRKTLASQRLREPLMMKSANNAFRLEFDCRRCEMKLWSQP